MLSELSALTFILLTGFLFQATVLPLRIRSSLHNRYHTLFGAAVWGVLLYFIFSYFLSGAIAWIDSKFLLSEVFAPFSSETNIQARQAVVFAFLFVVTLYGMSKLVGSLATRNDWNWYARARDKVVSFAFKRYGSNMLRTVNEAYERSLPIQISLTNRKMYIGLVTDTVDPESGYLDFRIAPFESGYRKSETLEYVSTTNYRDFYELFEFFKDHESEYLKSKNSNNRTKNPEDEFAEPPDEIVFTVKAKGSEITMPGNELREMANNFGVVIKWDEVQTISIWDKRLSEYFKIVKSQNNNDS